MEETSVNIYRSQMALGISNKEALRRALLKSQLDSSIKPYSEQIQEIYQAVFNAVGYIERLREEKTPPKKHEIRVILSKLRSIRKPVDTELLDISIFARIHICAFSVLFQKDPLRIFVSSVAVVIFSLSAMGIHPGRWKNKNFQDVVDVLGIVSLIGIELVAVKNIVEITSVRSMEVSNSKMIGLSIVFGILFTSYLVLFCEHVKKWIDSKPQPKVTKQETIHRTLTLKKWKKLANDLKIYEERIWKILEEGLGEKKDTLEDLWEEKAGILKNLGFDPIRYEPLLFPIVFKTCLRGESPHRFSLDTVLEAYMSYNQKFCALCKKSFEAEKDIQLEVEACVKICDAILELLNEAEGVD